MTKINFYSLLSVNFYINIIFNIVYCNNIIIKYVKFKRKTNVLLKITLTFFLCPFESLGLTTHLSCLIAIVKTRNNGPLRQVHNPPTAPWAKFYIFILNSYTKLKSKYINFKFSHPIIMYRKTNTKLF
jgi:hypothetical protein